MYKVHYNETKESKFRAAHKSSAIIVNIAMGAIAWNMKKLRIDIYGGRLAILHSQFTLPNRKLKFKCISYVMWNIHRPATIFLQPFWKLLRHV